MKKLYFTSLIALSLGMFGQQYCYIDFGDAAQSTSPTTWNNVTVLASQRGKTDITLTNMVDNTGAGIGMNFAIYQDTSGTYFPFDNFNGAGTTAPSSSIPFPTTAARDSFFGEFSAFNGATYATSGFTLSGLDPAKYYTFNIFASRAGVTDNREAKYTVTGSSSSVVALNASNNTSNTVFVNNMMPSSSGTISVVITKGDNNTNSNGFFYIGAVEMMITTTPLAVNEAQAKSRLFAYPVPANNVLNIVNPKNGSQEVLVYDTSGKLVIKKMFQSNDDKFVLDVASLPKGIYFYKIGNLQSKFIKD